MIPCTIAIAIFVLSMIFLAYERHLDRRLGIRPWHPHVWCMDTGLAVVFALMIYWIVRSIINSVSPYPLAN